MDLARVLFSGAMTLLLRWLAYAALLCGLALGCSVSDDRAPSATPTALPSALPTPTEDPDLVSVAGEVIVINRYADGHPRQIGIAAAPDDGTTWSLDGKEQIYLWDGPLARALADELGSEAVVRGRLQVGNVRLRTIFPVSFSLDGASQLAPDPRPVVDPADSREGRVVVVERYSGGHPKRIGIETTAGPLVELDDSNKSRELRFRIGRRLRVEGEESDRGFRVASYTDLDGCSAVAAGEGFRMCFLAGGHDLDGNFMGGVEIDTLAAFDGRIFAGVSYRRNTQEDSADPEPPGAQVLVLDRADGLWRVDFTLPREEAGNAPRFVFLKAIELETTGDGTPLEPPLRFLAGVSGNGDVYLRSPGDSANWRATGLPDVVRANTESTRRPDARSLITHRDRVTGISYLFVGAFLAGRRGDANGIYRGVYDEDEPGLISWAPEPEYPYTASAERPWRVMGLTETETAAYASIGTLLLRRQDGAEAEWQEVFRDELPAAFDSLRQATSIGPGGGEPLLLFGIEGPNNRMVSVDAADDHLASVEIVPVELLGPSLTGLAACNGPAARELDDGSIAAISGVEVFRPLQLGSGIDDPDLGRFYDWTDGLVLWREPDGSYVINRIVDPTLEVHPPLVGARAILAHSPFPGEEDIVYLGGFDHNGQLFHNTAWIFKAHVEDLARGILRSPPAG